jgi:hypothetical protein
LCIKKGAVRKNNNEMNEIQIESEPEGYTGSVTEASMEISDDNNAPPSSNSSVDISLNKYMISDLRKLSFFFSEVTSYSRG